MLWRRAEQTEGCGTLEFGETFTFFALTTSKYKINLLSKQMNKVRLSIKFI